MKKPSLREKIEVYEAFFHRLNFHRSITLNEKAVEKMLELTDAWSCAHQSRNTKDSEKKTTEAVNLAFDKLRTLP